MPPAVVPVEDDAAAAGGGAGEEAAHFSCHVAWLAWWGHARCLLASTFLPCPPALAKPATVRGTLFVPSAGGDRRVRLFLQEHVDDDPAGRPVGGERFFLVLDLPPGLAGADVAAAGRIVLEYQRQWAPAASPAALLGSPKWLVYCNGRRVGFAAAREGPSDAEGWVLEKLKAVTAGAGRLPGGGVEYLRGRFDRIVASSDAESFYLVEPIGWQGVGGGACDGGLSIFFHRI